MKRPIRGFTIVELLIVVVVMGILSSIGILAWGGAVTSSNNRARAADIKQWVSSFDNYKGRFGIWPTDLLASDASTATVCLGSFGAGSNNPTNNGKCGQYTSSTSPRYIPDSASASLNTEIAKIGKLPANSGPAYKTGTLGIVGPVVYLSRSTNGGTGDITVTGKFIGFFQGSSCPSGFANDSGNTPSATMLTSMGSGILACRVNPNPSFTYNPN